MERISSNMTNIDMQYHLRLREWNMNELNNKMAAQTRIKNLRDDPLAAGRSTRYSSEIARLKRYAKNIDAARGNNAIAEGYIQDVNNIMQRIREIGIQGANGIYDTEQLGYLGEEVDQLLQEMVVIANSRGPDGSHLFAGFRNNTEPFPLSMGNVENAGGRRIVAVDYVGNIGENRAEIAENAYMELNIPGNKVFWSENQQVYSVVDATAYQVQEDTAIRIDGVEIPLNAGDNIYAIIDRINASDAAVRAKLDPVRNSLVLSTTAPHQIWLEDAGGGDVLQSLGILKQTPGQQPPRNLADNALVFGGSLFDMVIHIRDSLFKGDILDVGGAGLRGIEEGMENLRTVLAELGAKDNRLAITANRHDYETPEIIALNAREVDLDITEAITELKMLEYTHKAALGATARILQPTLLDYLR